MRGLLGELVAGFGERLGGPDPDAAGDAGPLQDRGAGYLGHAVPIARLDPVEGHEAFTNRVDLHAPEQIAQDRKDAPR